MYTLILFYSEINMPMMMIDVGMTFCNAHKWHDPVLAM